MMRRSMPAQGRMHALRSLMLHLCRFAPTQQQVLLQLHRSPPWAPCSLRPGCPRVEGRTGAWQAIKVWHELMGALGATATVHMCKPTWTYLSSAPTLLLQRAGCCPPLP